MSRTELPKSLKDTAVPAAGDGANAKDGPSNGDPLAGARADAFLLPMRADTLLEELILAHWNLLALGKTIS